MSAANQTLTHAVAPQELDGLLLADTLRAGIYRLFRQTDHINKINVFPVPDGDTGTNMSMTLSAVLTAIDRQSDQHAGSVLVRVADAALDGARGNSGAILAQFLLGLGDAAGHLGKLGLREFSSALKQGVQYARDALSQPKEGTILTVIGEFSTAAEGQLPNVKDFAALFARTLGQVRNSLEATRGQLAELKAAGVVDAGALGFVEMLEGMAEFLGTGRLETVAIPMHAGDEPMAGLIGAEAVADQRYCTECLVKARSDHDIDLRQLREQLSLIGTSLVVGGSKRKAKIHIHVDDPQTVFGLAAEYGEVSAEKADDMLQQQRAAHHGGAQRVAVVTDSGADIPEAISERLGIHMVPVRVHFGNQSFLDKVSLTSAEFYREIVNNPVHPKTSQPPPGDFRRMFEFLSSHFSGVVSINLTSLQSGTHNAALTAAQRMTSPERPIVVVDSRNASIGEGLVVIAAAEAAAAGADLTTVSQVARRAVEQTQTFALIRDIGYAVRGGRIPASVGRLAKWLRLNVILRTTDGRVAAGGALLGNHALLSRFVRFVRKRVTPKAQDRLRILIAHGAAETQAEVVKQKVLSAFAEQRIEFCEITDVGSAIGVHGGPGTLIVAVQILEDQSADRA